MSLLDALFSRVGRPAGRALDPAIRDIVHAVLKEHGYASPAEVQALRDEVRDMRGRVDGMQRRLDEVVRQADEVRTIAANSVAESRAALAEATRATETKAVAAPPHVAAAAPQAAAPSPLVAEPRGDCKVDGCDSAVRSKGFCSPHYQQWRRGTLKGFAGPEGLVVGVEGITQVDPSYAGCEIRVGEQGVIYADGEIAVAG